jgi:hypothetical protein
MSGVSDGAALMSRVLAGCSAERSWLAGAWAAGPAAVHLRRGSRQRRPPRLQQASAAPASVLPPQQERAPSRRPRSGACSCLVAALQPAGRTGAWCRNVAPRHADPLPHADTCADRQLKARDPLRGTQSCPTPVDSARRAPSAPHPRHRPRHSLRHADMVLGRAIAAIIARHARQLQQPATTTEHALLGTSRRAGSCDARGPHAARAHSSDAETPAVQRARQREGQLACNSLSPADRLPLLAQQQQQQQRGLSGGQRPRLGLCCICLAAPADLPRWQQRRVEAACLPVPLPQPARCASSADLLLLVA